MVNLGLGRKFISDLYKHEFWKGISNHPHIVPPVCSTIKSSSMQYCMQFLFPASSSWYTNTHGFISHLWSFLPFLKNSSLTIQASVHDLHHCNTTAVVQLQCAPISHRVKVKKIGWTHIQIKHSRHLHCYIL